MFQQCHVYTAIAAAAALMATIRCVDPQHNLKPAASVLGPDTRAFFDFMHDCLTVRGVCLNVLPKARVSRNALVL